MIYDNNNNKKCPDISECSLVENHWNGFLVVGIFDTILIYKENLVCSVIGAKS